MSATGILFTAEGAREVTLSGDVLVDEIRKPMTWQPIETAPKDGTHILLFDPEADYDSSWNDYEGRYLPRIAVAHWKPYPNGYGGWKGYYSGIDAIENPTHWMPLPEPPGA
jgi:hypothetical protein